MGGRDSGTSMWAPSEPICAAFSGFPIQPSHLFPIPNKEDTCIGVCDRTHTLNDVRWWGMLMEMLWLTVNQLDDPALPAISYSFRRVACNVATFLPHQSLTQLTAASETTSRFKLTRARWIWWRLVDWFVDWLAGIILCRHCIDEPWSADLQEVGEVRRGTFRGFG